MVPCYSCEPRPARQFYSISSITRLRRCAGGGKLSDADGGGGPGRAGADGKAIDDQAAAEDDTASDNVENQLFLIDRPIAIKRRGIEARIVIPGASGRDPDSSLVDLIARAHLYLDRLTDGSVSSIADLARELCVHRADISRILPLAFLSPGITDMILTGCQPADLTVRTLARGLDIPPAWTNQAGTLGV